MNLLTMEISQLNSFSNSKTLNVNWFSVATTTAIEEETHVYAIHVREVVSFLIDVYG